jgi:prolyl 4-hydroxylase
MQKTPETPETLDDWLKSQIKRGCSLESMIATMQSSGYSAADSSNHVVRAFVAAGLLDDTSAILLPSQTSTYQTQYMQAESGLVAPATNSDSAAAALQAQTAWSAINERRSALAPLKPVMRLDAPRMMVFEGLLSDEECDTLIQLSQTKMQDSQVIDPTSGAFVRHPERTSRGTHFEHQSHAVVIAIENRIHDLFGFCVAQQEAMQILHYGIGGEYKPHYDFFPPTEAGSFAAINAAGQRLATLIMYLNTPETGGATGLPNIGLTVTAKKGNAIYFENIDPQGKPDPQTLHAGLPVLAGEKWIATKWLRERTLF